MVVERTSTIRDMRTLIEQEMGLSTMLYGLKPWLHKGKLDETARFSDVADASENPLPEFSIYYQPPNLPGRTPVQIQRNNWGRPSILDCDLSSTLGDLKYGVYELTGTPVDRQKLTIGFFTKLNGDNGTLASHGIKQV